MLGAALLSQKASVVLVEKNEVEFFAYRNASHRELHPNIIFWPFQDPTPATLLPFLNWGQAPATEVVEALKSEWKEAFSRKIEIVPAEVIAIDRSVSPLAIRLNNNTTLNADICILATGFGSEVQFGSLTTPAYWSPASIVEQTGEIMVSGSGDGGLIDALSPILGKDVTKAAHIIAARLWMKPIIEDIKSTETRRRSETLSGSKDSSDPCRFYSTVTLEPEDAEKLTALIKCKPAPRVTLLHESTSAYSFSAAPINKVLVAHFSNGSARCVSHVKGKLSHAGRRNEMVPDDGSPEQLDPPSRFDKVFVRHGAVPAAAGLLPDQDIAMLKKLAELCRDAAEVSGYDEVRYAWSKKGIGSADVGLKPLVNSVRRALYEVARAYKFELSNVKIAPECFTDGKPITVTLPLSDRDETEQLHLFPMKVGPATVVLAEPDTSRGIAYE
jgi:hypothetical protein